MNNKAEINSKLFDFKGNGLKLSLKDSAGNDTMEVELAERFLAMIQMLWLL